MKDTIKVILFSAVASSLIALNTGFFFEDLWFNFTDKDQFYGATYKWQTSSAVNDFWPKTAKVIPRDLAPKDPLLIEGSGSGKLIEKRNNTASYFFDISSDQALIQIPIVYFPGWEASVNKKKVNVYPSGDLGLITLKVESGKNIVNLNFKNTPIRTTGNLVSLMSFSIFITLLIYANSKKIWIK